MRTVAHLHKPQWASYGVVFLLFCLSLSSWGQTNQINSIQDYCGGPGLSLQVATLTNPSNGATYTTSDNITLSFYNNEFNTNVARFLVVPDSWNWVSDICAFLCNTNNPVPGGVNTTISCYGYGNWYYTIPAGTLSPGTYRWTVRVGNGGNQSCWPWYRTFTIVAPTPTPSTPTGLSASSGGTSTINLSWSSVSGATSYDIYRDGSYWTSTSSTSITNSGLSAGTQYCYCVRACNSSGCSGNSNQACATTNIPTPTPAAPSLSAMATGASTISLSWNATSYATSYNVYQNGSYIGNTASTSYGA